MTTVLIVDDNARFRRVARELLEDLGFRVLGEAGDGRQAITEAARLRPDAVLLDVHMPDIDGFCVARQLTGRQRAPRVLLISTDASAGSAQTLECSRAVGFLAKDQLAATELRRLLGSAP